MTEQLQIEPLTSEKRATLSDTLVAMLMARRVVGKQKKEAVSGYNEQLKDLDRDIYELTKLLNQPPQTMPGPEVTAKHPDDREGYATDHQARAGIETIEITGDDLDSELKVLDEGLGF